MCWHVCANTHCQSAPGRSPLPHVYLWPLQSGLSQGNLKGHICNLWKQLHTLNSPGPPPSNQNTQQCCVKAQKSVTSYCQHWWLQQKKEKWQEAWTCSPSALQVERLVCVTSIVQTLHLLRKYRIWYHRCTLLWFTASQKPRWHTYRKGMNIQWCTFTVSMYHL